jgi:hypothetical protein
MHPGSSLRGSPTTRTVLLSPADDNRGITFSTDLTTILVNDEWTKANGKLTSEVGPATQSIFIGVTDVAATDLTFTILIEGTNIWGEPISETISHTAVGNQNYQTLHCYEFVEKITWQAIANAAAGDIVDIGWLRNPTSPNIASPRYALAAKVVNSASVMGLLGAKQYITGGVAVTPLTGITLDPYYTFQPLVPFDLLTNFDLPYAVVLDHRLEAIL